jgi:hypothetical protein
VLFVKELMGHNTARSEGLIRKGKMRFRSIESCPKRPAVKGQLDKRRNILSLALDGLKDKDHQGEYPECQMGTLEF